jgi:hypothetical protein
MTTPESIDVCISFDTTGSMSACIGRVRREVESVVRQLFNDIPGLHVSIIIHGDYCDAPNVITTLDFTDDQELICDFIKTAPNTSGGDAPECYELVLNRCRSLKWRSGRSKVLVLIGDATPHGPSYPQNTENLDWRNELGLLHEAGIHVYAVQCLARSGSTPFYAEMAEKTNGLHLELHQFNAIVDLIMAICYKQKGEEALFTFEKKVQQKGRLTDVVGHNLDKLAGRKPREIRSTSKTWSKSGAGKRILSSLSAKADINVEKLEPVHPSRFQVLSVTEKTPIRRFAEENGLKFAKGRGFYEFTKTVEVQPYKEVVLLDNETGAMFSGDDARTMIGLPPMNEGTNVKLRPAPLDGFTAFIQSTSINRALLPGTRFLYEMEDHLTTGEAK